MLEQARRFLEIRWLSAPAALANPVLLGWLLGVQYVRAPVILLIVGNLLNIVLDIWLVMGPAGTCEGRRRQPPSPNTPRCCSACGWRGG